MKLHQPHRPKMRGKEAVVKWVLFAVLVESVYKKGSMLAISNQQATIQL
jgi:hypothetical protein